MMKSKMKPLILTGNNLTINDIYSLVINPMRSVKVADSVFISIEQSRNFLEQEIGNRIIYGVNTGFGPMASHIINQNQVEQLQENLIKSHAAGMGSPIHENYVLAAMVARLNMLVKGYSGVSMELVKQLELFINKRILPIIPEHGAVGTSGDLVQLSHIALALMGEGEAIHKGKRQQVKHIIKQLGIKPYSLKSKEGLSLINGTSVMSGIGAFNCMHANRILTLAIRTGVFSLELVNAYSDSISETLQKIRPHEGQNMVARIMRQYLMSSKLMKERELSALKFQTSEKVREISDTVQEIYSFRCIPQILGPIYDTLAKAYKDIETEINSVTDNPIIDAHQKTFLHGGNFHGDYIALAMDQLKAVLVKLTLLSERRINFFLNQKINHSFPPFLNLEKPGLTLGLQGLQFVATSTTAHSQTLAFPHYVHTISTNGDNQDIVSMGTDAALFTSKVIENAYIVLAIELVTLAQATDILKNKEELSKSSLELLKIVRSIMPSVKNDRVISNELNELTHALKTCELKLLEFSLDHG